MKIIFFFFLFCVSLVAQTNDSNLFEAAKLGDLTKVQSLLSSGEDPNQLNAEGASALHLASAEGHVAVVEYLLDHKAQIDLLDRNFLQSPLVNAAEFGRLAVVKILLKRGAKAELKNKFGSNILSAVVNNMGIASSKTSKEEVYQIIDLLLSHGADINSQNKNGESLLHMRAHLNEVELATYLLKRNLKINLVAANGENAFDYACKGKADVEMFDLLLSKGLRPERGFDKCFLEVIQRSNLNLVKKIIPFTKKDSWPFVEASIGEHVDSEKIALLLLDAGADHRSKLSSGITALHAAAITNKLELAEHLIKKKIDVNAIAEGGGFTSGKAIHYAARYGHPEILQVLLKAGVLVNEKNQYGETPLHLAVMGPIDRRPSDGPGPDWNKMSNYLKVIKILIDHKADVEVKERFGKTPIELLKGINNLEFKQKASKILSQ